MVRRLGLFETRQAAPPCSLGEVITGITCIGRDTSDLASNLFLHLTHTRTPSNTYRVSIPGINCLLRLRSTHTPDTRTASLSGITTGIIKNPRCAPFANTTTHNLLHACQSGLVFYHFHTSKLLTLLTPVITNIPTQVYYGPCKLVFLERAWASLEFQKHPRVEYVPEVPYSSLIRRSRHRVTLTTPIPAKDLLT